MPYVRARPGRPSSRCRNSWPKAARRRGSRTGPLLVVAGYLWYVGDLYFVFPTASIVPLLSFAFRGLYDVVLAFVLLSFPGGRLETPVRRVVVATVAVAYAARSVAFLLIAGLGLGSAMPSTPGYVGIYQFVAVSILTPFCYSRTDAIAYILLVQAMSYVVLAFWGLIGLGVGRDLRI